jgi:uncharacterized membrane protein YeiH
VATFLLAHRLHARLGLLLWLDAVGLAVFAVIGARTAMEAGAGPLIATAMGVATATFGGIIRDVLGAESPVILRREVYVTAALAGAATYVVLNLWLSLEDLAFVAGFLIGFGVRAAGIHWNLSLPRYQSTASS